MPVLPAILNLVGESSPVAIVHDENVVVDVINFDLYILKQLHDPEVLDHLFQVLVLPFEVYDLSLFE